MTTVDPTADGGGPDPSDTPPPVEQRPAIAGETAREGWYRSPSGHPVHADGPSQRRAFADRGFVEIDEDEARRLVAERAELDVSDRDGNFDAAEVAKAVSQESTTKTRKPRTRRS